MKRILHLVSVKNITFKIDIHQQLRPLTANYLAMFKVTSTTIYTLHKAQTKCKTRCNSQGMILNGFAKKSFFRIGMWNSRPPPLHGENHLILPFWLFDARLRWNLGNWQWKYGQTTKKENVGNISKECQCGLMTSRKKWQQNKTEEWH